MAYSSLTRLDGRTEKLSGCPFFQLSSLLCRLNDLLEIGNSLAQFTIHPGVVVETIRKVRVICSSLHLEGKSLIGKVKLVETKWDKGSGSFEFELIANILAK